MSALAQLYQTEGHTVSGSDRVGGPTMDMLEKKGVHVIVGQRAENVPANADLVVYSDAIHTDHPERMRAAELGTREISYFKALGEVSAGRMTIAVSGTHGKTTTTAMLVKILKDAGKNPSAVIGSLVKDFDSNFVHGDHNLFVVEACEWRDHLLELRPQVLVITNIEWDHTDWFKTEADMRATFQKAIDSIPPGGKVIDASVYQAEPEFELQLIGEFNKNNARAAAAAAKAVFPDITNEQIAESLKTFHGTWRRFEYKGQTKAGAVVYDDYAHHPTAIRETIKGVREKFPDKKIVIAFHPHLYSRTRDLMQDFARAFDGADSVVLAPIFAAREDPVNGVTSEVLAQKINNAKPNLAKAVPSLDAVYDELASVGADSLIITMGAGDIYKVADRLIA
ncbi:MAG: UDP-N-acetylmuramate--L-alanine ligase, UDP-N-acetylmuramate--alanine ligase [Candidatus Parcubacteria bacterium]